MLGHFYGDLLSLEIRSFSMAPKAPHLITQADAQDSSGTTKAGGPNQAGTDRGNWFPLL
jgi:hypothetical protein